MRSNLRFAKLKSSVVAALAFVMICIAELPALFSSRVAGIAPLESKAAPARAVAQTRRVSRPLGFEPNRGQSASQVRFLARTSAYNLFLTDRGAVISMTERAPRSAPVPHASFNKNATGDSVWIEMRGGSSHPQMAAVEQLPGHINYLIGRDRSGWHQNVPIYGRVIEHDVWKGIDLAWRGNQRRLECDLVVAPEADPSEISLGFRGERALSVDADGNLVIDAGGRKIKLLKPVVYQQDGAVRREIAGGYALADGLGGEKRVNFVLAPYDRSRQLVIDPTVEQVYSTFFGGSGNDEAYGIAVDNSGSAYLAGKQLSDNFPGQPVGSSTPSGASNAFVTKFAPGGQSLVYSDIIGGAGSTAASAIAVDPVSGVAYVAGSGEVGNFPQTTNSLPGIGCVAVGDGTQAFVVELSADGSSIDFSGCFGGLNKDGGERNAPLGIALDTQDNVYLAGVTSSPTFTVTGNAVEPNALGSLPNYFDGFVVKIDPSSGELVYSTYLGGSSSASAGLNAYESVLENEITAVGDFSQSIAVDSSGNMYVGGSASSSSNYPVVNAMFSSNRETTDGIGGYTGVITKICSDGSFGSPKGSACPDGSMPYSTYFGGSTADNSSATDAINAIAVDSSGHAFVTGYTSAPDFPTQNPYQQYVTGGDAFVTEFSADGQSLDLFHPVRRAGQLWSERMVARAQSDW